MPTVIKYKLTDDGLKQVSIIDVEDYEFYKRYNKDIISLPDGNAKTLHVCQNDLGQIIDSFYSKRA